MVFSNANLIVGGTGGCNDNGRSENGGERFVSGGKHVNVKKPEWIIKSQLPRYLLIVLKFKVNATSLQMAKH